MAKLTFPARSNGLGVTVLIGLDGATTTNLYAAGKPMPAPVEVPAEIDCGSTVTAVAPWILQRLGLTRGIPATTQTMGGLVSVSLFQSALQSVIRSNLQRLSSHCPPLGFRTWRSLCRMFTSW